MDILLVGDSVGTTLLGFETTVPVTFMMFHHTSAVSRETNGLIVSDLPLGIVMTLMSIFLTLAEN